MTVREQVRKLIGDAADRGEPTGYDRLILFGLQFKPTYQGTVDPVVVARRRARNKAARRSRRINRLAVKR